MFMGVNDKERFLMLPIQTFFISVLLNRTIRHAENGRNTYDSCYPPAAMKHDKHSTDSPDAVARTKGAWNIADSRALYHVDAWGQGYFGVNELGHVVVRPEQNAERSIDLYDVVQGLKARDLTAPVVVRFPGIRASPPSAERRLRTCDRRKRIPKSVRGGLSDQSQPATTRGRGGVPLRQRVRLRARSRQ
jgi:hypothetical protein